MVAMAGSVSNVEDVNARLAAVIMYDIAIAGVKVEDLPHL
jgi:hypothetical protein